ncbi:UDP-glycosyltransferase UGT5-like [Prorops nasuta]|uniref:UDP-glycosyltransferase UGT5-like n=1 Tax=Prorops nasuta TaxID=863751 RepID=UPI0034CDC21C
MEFCRERMYFVSWLICAATLIGSNGAYKILALAPYCGKSHWQVISPLLEELVRRGHDLTVVSHYRSGGDDGTSRGENVDEGRYRNIYIGQADATCGMHTKNIDAIRLRSSLAEMHAVLESGVSEVCEKGLEHPEVQRLLSSDESYDLVITEIFNSDCFLGFVEKLGAPTVAIRSAPLSPWSNDRMANPDNPAYVPNSLTGNPTRMTLLERLNNLIATIYYKALYAYYDRKCWMIARKHFGDHLPRLYEIAKKTSMILVNSHYSMQYARPLVPGIKEVAGMHIARPKPLPKELDDWISGAKEGAIYFSLGSMLKSSSMSVEKRDAFLEAFGEMPQRVLMKWEDANLTGIPDNVKISAWAPQYDVLRHPKVKLFISHGGMLSSIEAAYSGTPVMVIPAYGDQPTNAALLEENGMAIRVDYRSLTKRTILSVTKKLLYDARYEASATKISSVIKDRLLPPVEEAAYWVEYVARHKGAPFLKSPAIELPLHQYLLLDVGFILFLAFTALLAILFFLVRAFVAFLARRRKPKNREKKE